MAEISLGFCIHRKPVEEQCLLCMSYNAQRESAVDPADVSPVTYDPDDFDYTECDHGNPIDECEECLIDESVEFKGGQDNG